MSLPERISRRAVLAASASVLIMNCAGVRAGEEVSKQLAAIRARIGGRMGVHALDTQTGRRIGIDDDGRYAMASTFKLLLAACVLSRVDRNELSLVQTEPFGEKEVVVRTDFATKALEKGSLTIEEMCEAVIEVSDNSAANMLLRRIGGPEGFTRFVRALGDKDTRLDRFETELNSNLPGDPRDTTTPRAMVSSMRRVLVQDALSKPSRARLIQWLVQSKTGLQRLRAGLPATWKAGDKTGTGQNGAINNLAITWPPGRTPILIAVYLSESKEKTEVLASAHAEIAGIVARALT